jgi:hypothetical protein
VSNDVISGIAGVRGLAGQATQIATAVKSGQIGNVISHLPGPARRSAELVVRSAFTTGLNQILLVAAVIALVSAVISLAAIRSRDFAQQQG